MRIPEHWGPNWYSSNGCILTLASVHQILSHKPIVPCKRLAVRNFRILMWCAHVDQFIVTEKNWKPFQKIRPRPAASAYIVQESCMKFRYVKREWQSRMFVYDLTSPAELLALILYWWAIRTNARTARGGHGNAPLPGTPSTCDHVESTQNSPDFPEPLMESSPNALTQDNAFLRHGVQFSINLYIHRVILTVSYQVSPIRRLHSRTSFLHLDLVCLCRTPLLF